MTTTTIRELRQNWPAVERRLKSARQPILITRDGEPVAQLSLPPAREPRGTAFDPAAHRRWVRTLWGGKAPGASSEAWLTRDRADRR